MVNIKLSFCATLLWLLSTISLLKAVDNKGIIPAREFHRYYTNYRHEHFIRHTARSGVMCALICDDSAQCIGYSYENASTGACYLHSDVTESLISRNGALPWTDFIWVLLPRYLGCWADSMTGRSMEKHVILKLTVTPLTCIAGCKPLGYKFAGLQFYSECWCGNSYWRVGRSSEDGCNYRCHGNSDIICGGSLRNSVYRV